jgi:hypothetical protein
MNRTDLFYLAAIATCVALSPEQRAAWAAAAASTSVYLAWLLFDVVKSGLDAYVAIGLAEKKKREREERERRRRKR